MDTEEQVAKKMLDNKEWLAEQKAKRRTDEEIAKQLGCSTGQVERARYKHGITVNYGPAQKRRQRQQGILNHRDTENGWYPCPQCQATNIWKVSIGRVWVSFTCGCGHSERLARLDFLPDDVELCLKDMGTAGQRYELPKWMERS